jgi:hypothetical protein
MEADEGRAGGGDTHLPNLVSRRNSDVSATTSPRSKEASPRGTATTGDGTSLHSDGTLPSSPSSFERLLFTRQGHNTAQRQSTRKKIVEELHSTERTYVDNLRYLLAVMTRLSSITCALR